MARQRWLRMSARTRPRARPPIIATIVTSIVSWAPSMKAFEVRASKKTDGSNVIVRPAGQSRPGSRRCVALLDRFEHRRIDLVVLAQRGQGAVVLERLDRLG